VEILLVLVVVAIIVWFVSVPLRRSRATAAAAAEQLEDPRVAELEARKEAKYREIRDAELDREQGKLSVADWGRQDAALRREAIEILRELDRARAEAKGRVSSKQ
jgi:flagellar biosynthesis/type III secretory pathway M-ring protein FliF/YscJ